MPVSEGPNGANGANGASGASGAAAAELFRLHHEGLRRFLVRFTGDGDLAADVAQEAFVRLLERPPRERGPAWLYRVAVNLARDRARVSARRRVLLRAAAARLPSADPPVAPDAALDAERRRLRVAQALATLSPKERTALLMREEGFAQHEIARAVGTTTKSVGTLTARALRKLADRLEEEREVKR